MRTAIVNVRVFDGERLLEPSTVVVDGPVIGTDAGGAQVVDAEGGVLLPGLIDAHVHLRRETDLDGLGAFGVTTALDMGCWPPQTVDGLRGLPGLPDIRSAGTPAIGAGGMHARMPSMPRDAILGAAAEADPFVAKRVAEGSDYLKIVAEPPGPDMLDQATISALVAAARTHGKLSVVHAAALGAVRMAVEAGADVLTHEPMDAPIDDELAARIAADGRVTVPTLVMAETIIANLAPPGRTYATARESVAALHRAGVPVLAGTDANSSPGSPATVAHGESLHRELELLVDAGLTTVEALQAATSLPARHFGLDDRGVIEPGRRADLVLLTGDPVTDIRATRQIARIWCGGIERTP